MIEAAQNPVAHLRHWVEQQLQRQQLLPINECVQWHAIDGDAGFRRYFRLQVEPSLMAVLAPPATENSRQFCQVAQLLRRGGVHAPQVLAHDFERGFMLLEDLGCRSLLDELDDDSVASHYAEALVELMRIQQCASDYACLPAYDRVQLLQEMQLFPQWFVGQLLDYSLSDSERSLLQSTFDFLCDSAVAQPQVVVHRDFHSRNIMCADDGTLGVIDFQDAVMGPVTYDVVSLLRDCYVSWPQHRVEQWALTYADMASELGIIPTVDKRQFLRWFDLMGLQRHLKVLGIFARLSLRDHKHGYLNDLPLVLHYTRHVLSRYDELAEFSEWFGSVVVPRVMPQPWMQPLPKLSGEFEAE